MADCASQTVWIRDTHAQVCTIPGGEQGDDAEVGPAQFSLGVRECERPSDALGEREDADEDELRHV